MSAIPIHGTVRPGFELVRDAFAANFAMRGELGAAFAAYQDNELIVDLWGGHVDRSRERPWARDTLAPVMSTTKPIAALVVARLVDQGRLDYEQPLSGIWPGFGVHGKGRVTLAEALSHQAGVPGFINPIDPQLWFDSHALSAAVADLEPLWPPGAAGGYHPVTNWVRAGEAARRAAPTGRSLARQLADDICRPAGIDFHIGLADADHDRVAEIQRPPAMPDFGPITPSRQAAFLSRWSSAGRPSPAWRRAEMPGVNGHGSARAVAALYGILAHEGELFGLPLINRDVFRAATRLRRAGPDLVLPFDLAWAAGVQCNSLGHYGPDPGAFGHAGWGGSMGFADPARRLSAAYVMNRQSAALMGDPRPAALIEAIYARLC